MEDRPVARTRGLLTEEVGDELVVYDTGTDLVCWLNSAAALVWRGSDGSRTVSDLAALVADRLGEFADEDLVRLALDSLADNDLLESGYPAREPAAAELSRRRFVRRVGAAGGAALVLPFVESAFAPASAAAASPGPSPSPSPSSTPSPSSSPSPSPSSSPSPSATATPS